MKIFLSGIMQGSRPDELIGPQDYRIQLMAALAEHWPEAEIIDPWTLHPDSIHYGIDKVREAFTGLVEAAAEADLVLVYIPRASMGSAAEMWEAHKAGKYILVVTPLIHNWLVRVTASEILPNLASLLALIESGELQARFRE